MKVVSKDKIISKDIEGFEGKYRISENGEILSVKNKLKFLTPFVTKQGLNIVTLSNGTKNSYTRLFVSQLVAKAFLPDYPKDGKNPKLFHLNGIKSDDRKENLKILIKRPIYCSEYRGVTWSNASQKWVASMIVKKKRIELGKFDLEIEASECYEKELKNKKLQTELRQMNEKLLKKEEKKLELQH